MDIQTEILLAINTLNKNIIELRNVFVSADSDYCGMERACSILGLISRDGKPSEIKLKRARKYMTKWRSGRPITYYIPELYSIKSRMDNKEINL